MKSCGVLSGESTTRVPMRVACTLIRLICLAASSTHGRL